MKKNMKVGSLVAVSSAVSLGMAAAIAVPTVVNTANSVTNNQNTNSNISSPSPTLPTNPNVPSSPSVDSNVGDLQDLKNGVVLSDTLSFSATTQSQSLTRDVPEFEGSGFKYVEVTTESGKKDTQIQSTLYRNERKFMPILAKDFPESHPQNSRIFGERDVREVEKDIYPGWDRVVAENNSSNGFYYQGVKGVGLFDYKPSAVLKTVKPDAQNIKTLVLSLDVVENNYGKENSKKIFEHVIKVASPDMISLASYDSELFDLLPKDINGTFGDKSKSLKKMSLYGEFDNINKLMLPETLEEIEIYSPKMTKVDPLLFPKNANLIYDSFISSNFTSVDLSNRGKMTTDDLQKAVDIVYEERVDERYFQNHWAAGYIGHWNLRNTGLYSFNDVVVPPLLDSTGRFYIGSVEIETDSSMGPIQNEQIGSGNKPSNDSQIGEIFDWNTDGWSKVEEVVVTMQQGRPIIFEKAVSEIVGFINKYPNVKRIDVRNLIFMGGESQKQLVEAVKAKSPKAQNIEFVVVYS